MQLCPRRPAFLCLLLLLLGLQLHYHCTSAATTRTDEDEADGVRHIVPGVDLQKNRSRQCVDGWLGEGRLPQDHLAAVYLHAHSMEGRRDVMLGCSIRNLLQHVGAKTPLHIFVFAGELAVPKLAQSLAEQLGEDAQRVCLLPIPEAQWNYNPRRQEYLQPRNAKHGGDYVRMGLWRMLVPYNIISDLSYPYYLQVDDDLFIHKPLQYNIVQHMRARNYTIATHRMPVELWHVLYGLPELAAFYLRSNSLQPGNTLFAHVTPPNMSGLFSPNFNWWKNPDKTPQRGYDLRHLYGNFMIMNTQLWSDQRVQDWITLCIHSGGLERHRWQEQGVVSFVWLLFTDTHNLWHLERNELAWIHTRRPSRLKYVCPQLAQPQRRPQKQLQQAKQQAKSRRSLAAKL